MPLPLADRVRRRGEAACSGSAAAAARAKPQIAAELSGSAALRTVNGLSLHHRMRGSEGYRAAAELVRARLTEYGLEGVELISLPADGKIFYGTQRSRPAWNASFAELWEQRREAAAGWTRSASPPGPISPSAWPRTASAAGRGRAGGCRRGTSERTTRAGRPRQARPRLVPAGGGGGAGDRPLRRRRDRLLGPEPEDRLVGARTRASSAGAISTPSRASGLRLHGLAAPGAGLAGAARRGRPVRLRAEVEAGSRRLPHPHRGHPRPPRTRRSSIPATSTIPRRERTTTPAAAPASSRSRARCSD